MTESNQRSQRTETKFVLKDQPRVRLSFTWINTDTLVHCSEQILSASSQDSVTVQFCFSVENPNKATKSKEQHKAETI